MSVDDMSESGIYTTQVWAYALEDQRRTLGAVHTYSVLSSTFETSSLIHIARLMVSKSAQSSCLLFPFLCSTGN